MAIKWTKDLLDIYYKVRPKIDNGDLLEFSSNSFLGNAIRFVTKKDVNHTALVWCVEEFKKVKNRKFIMEALSQGIELNLISSRLKEYKGDVYWYHLKDEYNQFRDDVASICLLAEGRTDEIRYDYASIIRNMFSKVSVDVRKNSFCSEFAQWVLQEAKILKPQKKALRPGEFDNLGIYNPRIRIYSYGNEKKSCSCCK